VSRPTTRTGRVGSIDRLGSGSAGGEGDRGPFLGVIEQDGAGRVADEVEPGYALAMA
jgi:hypothetical protein